MIAPIRSTCQSTIAAYLACVIYFPCNVMYPTPNPIVLQSSSCPNERIVEIQKYIANEISANSTCVIGCAAYSDATELDSRLHVRELIREEKLLNLTIVDSRNKSYSMNPNQQLFVSFLTSTLLPKPNCPRPMTGEISINRFRNEILANCVAFRTTEFVTIRLCHILAQHGR